MNARLVIVGLMLVCGVAGAPARADERRSGAAFMSPQTQALQADDFANPGMLSVADGEAKWSASAGPNGKSCEGCHGDAKTAMRGVSARYPAIDVASGNATDLQGRINLCRTRHMGSTALPLEGPEILALSAFVGFQSRGMPIEPPAGPEMDAVREAGKALYTRRQGQLDFSCAACHDDYWGRRLGAAPIPQAHPTGYPLYRLEWQSIGSLQRRFRNCMVGVRAEPWAFGSQEVIALEAFLMERARGMPVETPAVRP
jgi:sulfur-oxidizing protein SoxA